MNEVFQNRREMNEVLRGIEMDELDDGTKDMVIDAYHSAKNTILIPDVSGIAHKKALYWGLFGVLIFLIINIFLSFISIPVLYYVVFCIAILANFSFIWLKSHKDKIDDIRGVINNWELLPSVGRESFMQNIHLQIAEKMQTMPVSERTFEILRYAVYVISGLLLANVLWQDRGLSARGFFIVLFCLILVIVMHMHISVQREWQLSGIVDDRKLLESYHKTLLSGYKKIMILSSIIAFIVLFFLAWFYLGSMISEVRVFLF